MSEPVFESLANKIAIIENDIVRVQAEVLFEIAQSTSNTAMAGYLEDVLNASAVGNGVATFYSGKDVFGNVRCP